MFWRNPIVGNCEGYVRLKQLGHVRTIGGGLSGASTQASRARSSDPVVLVAFGEHVELVRFSEHDALAAAFNETLLFPGA